MTARVAGRVRSLRARLVITVLLLFTLACVAIGVATSVSLQHFLDDRQDREVEMSVERFEKSATGALRPPPPGDGTPDGVPSGGFFLGPQGPGSIGAVVRDGAATRAELIDQGGVRADIPAADLALLATVAPQDRPQDLELSGGEYRVDAVVGSDGLTYVLGRPNDDVADVTGRLLLIEVVVLGGAVVVAGVAATVLVRRELRPLERVAGVAGQVGTLPLDRGEVHLAARVPDPDPRTEVGQVGTALNRMLDNVEGALAARQDSETRLRRFVADASHELRTPLAAIRGYAELSRREPDPVPAGTAHALVRISSQAERMSTLVEDLLLLARLDAGRPLERTPVDLTRLVLDAVGDAHVAGPGHRWVPDLPDEPVTVDGDAGRLAQVMANLLANARTHTPQGTTVTVGLTTEPGGAATLTVTDSGPGIAPETLPRVFERFARGAASRTRAGNDTPSTGLGLAIVSAVVAAHHGTVSVDSVPGRTTFTVRLPATP
ncbi:HAMP domain-containing sensor histidine kinase [Pseudonocardia sp. KRD291]|uniref:sensor histidine kinase n=1 Tax=Pseudonocardia sp. KRD291 TaxID=2792007 RepID=UPI0027E25ACF|nr:HAMP domain-containing sensor histidine kinase [Pseudonocardia sp. KRD291]